MSNKFYGCLIFPTKNGIPDAKNLDELVKNFPIMTLTLNKKKQELQ